MKVVVTGGSGFIGSHVLKELHSRDAHLILITRDRRFLPKSAESAEIVEHDILNLNSSLTPKIEDADVLIHLAWDYLNDYFDVKHCDSLAPAHFQFLKSFVDRGVSSIFIAGTCLEYGMQSGCLSENCELVPITQYGAGKVKLLRDLEQLALRQSFCLTWGRLFYVYGERQSPRSLYPLLKRALANGDKTFPMSPGQQVRDYLPVTDAAKIMVQLALDHPNSGEVNLCSGRGTKIKDLVEGWCQELGGSIELQLGVYPYPDYEPFEFWGDSSKLKSLLS